MIKAALATCAEAKGAVVIFVSSVAHYLANGRAAGRGSGRPFLLSVEEHVDIRLKRASGFTVREIAEAYMMKESTIYKASVRALPTGSADR